MIDPLGNAGMKTHWSIAKVVADILDLVKCFDAFSFSFIYKEGNASAHLLASLDCFCKLGKAITYL